MRKIYNKIIHNLYISPRYLSKKLYGQKKRKICGAEKEAQRKPLTMELHY